MGEYKPLGSEKLNGDEKLKRILELTYYNQKEKNKKTDNLLVKESLAKDGVSNKIYGIVKEKDGYYVKMGLNEQSLDYIGGLFMKNKNRFSSYAEALKRLELLRGEDNRLNEATKYVLKKSDTKEQEQPMPSDVPPSTADAVPPTDAAPVAEPTAEPTAEPSPESPAEPKKSDYMAEVQKFSGKLGQELRDQKDKLESDDIKYVLNMIISAVDLNKLDLEDLEEIGKKFEREEEPAAEEAPVAPEEAPAEPEEAPAEPSAEASAEEEVPFQPQEGEMYEDLGGLEEFINSEIDLSSYSDDLASEEINETDDIVEVDIEKLKSEVKDGIEGIIKKYFKKP
jgi:hypothetical protein